MYERDARSITRALRFYPPKKKGLLVYLEEKKDSQNLIDDMC